MDKQYYLRELIQNISSTEIVLEDIASQVNLSNISLESISQWRPDINLDISTISDFDTESNKIVINAIYTLSEKISINTARKSDNNLEICNSKIRYRLLMIADVTDSLRKALQNDAIRSELIKRLAETTGILMVFPYLRHMLDVLHKEMRLPIPPLPPFLIEKVINK